VCSGQSATTGLWGLGLTTLAFIRKRGNSYYLVHNVRLDGQVRQLHLARLGSRPRISEEVVKEVKSAHPFLQVDWEGLKERASRDLVQPLAHDSQYLRNLLVSVHNLHLDIADLPLPALELARDPELVAQMVSGLKLLRTTLDVKLNQIRKGKSLSLKN
jgi:hypothetical protein